MGTLVGAEAQAEAEAQAQSPGRTLIPFPWALGRGFSSRLQSRCLQCQKGSIGLLSLYRSMCFPGWRAETRMWRIHHSLPLEAGSRN